MYRRSLFGTAMLLLGASCVPPQVTGGGAKPATTASTAVIPVPARTLTIAQMTPDAPQIAPSLLLHQAIVPTRPASPFVGTAQDEENAGRALDCLTAAVYYEARSEPIDGQRAVAQVVLNRVRNPAFPNTVCGVVYQGAFRSTGCQFSFTCDGSMLFRREPDAWERARAVARAALNGSVFAPVGLATHYHTSAVSPFWAPSLARVATIGSHIFYRWPGAAGNPENFNQTYAGIEPRDDSAAAGIAPDGSGNGAQLLRYADGMTVAVHRGDVDAASPVAAQASTPFGIHLHYGNRSSDPAEVSATTSQGEVRIHVGTMPPEVNPA